MTEPGDGELIARFRKGDRAAFDVLVHRYGGRVLRVAQRFLGDPHEAMDVSQEVFVRAWGALPSWREEAELFTWLYRTALNLCHHRLRERARASRVASGAPAGAPPPEDDLEKAEFLQSVQKAVLDLPDRQRQVFLLRHERGLPLAQIARELGVSEGAAKASLHFALCALRDALKGRTRIG